MKLMQIAFAAGAIALHGVAQAVPAHEAVAAYSVGATDPEGNLIRESDRDAQNTTGDVTARASRQASARARDELGFDADISGEVDGSGMRLEERSAWQPSPLDGHTLQEVTATTYAQTRDEVNTQEAGWIRFTLDYSLRTLGEDSKASFAFTGLSINDTPSGQGGYTVETTYFEKELLGGAEAAELSGRWSSGWLAFSSGDELAAINPFLASYKQTLDGFASTALYAEQLADRPAGSAYAFLDLRLGYEIAPVPEPETYALLAAGLGVIAVARRRRVASR